jgi:putative FmdB family regulatory protein
MPTYRYRCKDCGESFEHTEHIAEHETLQIKCPKCGGQRVEHAPAPFVPRTSKKS